MATTTTPTPTPRRYGSITFAAEYLSVSEKTIRRMMSRGDITGVRIGPRLIRIDLDELDEALSVVPSANTKAAS